MKLFIIFIFVALLSITANASIPTPDNDRLNNQYGDITRNISIYGYIREGGLSATINKFTFTPQVIVNILDRRFDPNKMSAANKRDSTKNIKKFVQQIVIKTLNKLPGRSKDERKTVLIQALQTIGHPVEVDVRGTEELDFNKNKESPPTPLMSDFAADRFYDNIKGSIRYTPPTSPASITEIIHMSMDLFEDGVHEYGDDDTDYSNIQAITEKELNAEHRRPNFRTFLRFLKFMGVVPLNPEALKRSMLVSTATRSRSITVSVTPSKPKIDPSILMSPTSPGPGSGSKAGTGNDGSLFGDD